MTQRETESINQSLTTLYTPRRYVTVDVLATSAGHTATLTAGLDFYQGASYIVLYSNDGCKTAVFEPEAWNRQTDRRTDAQEEMQKIHSRITRTKTRMWTDAQCDGRPAEYS